MQNALESPNLPRNSKLHQTIEIRSKEQSQLYLIYFTKSLFIIFLEVRLISQRYVSYFPPSWGKLSRSWQLVLFNPAIKRSDNNGLSGIHRGGQTVFRYRFANLIGSVGCCDSSISHCLLRLGYELMSSAITRPVVGGTRV